MQNNINYKPNSQKVPSAPFAVDPSPTLDSGNNWSIFFSYTFASPQMVKHLPTMRETWVQSLGWEDPLKKEMALHSSTIALKIPWTEKPGRLHSMGSQSVGHDWANSLHFTSLRFTSFMGFCISFIALFFLVSLLFFIFSLFSSFCECECMGFFVCSCLFSVAFTICLGVLSVLFLLVC